MKKIITITSLIFTMLNSWAQNSTCIVSLDSLKGTYDGECSNGKANGEGRAIGVDMYEGAFKNGLPDGTGKYSWRRGGYYYGSWKKGLKEGKGEFHLPINGVDSAIIGYWKRDRYIGEYEKQYVIIANSSRLSKVDCRLIEKSGSDISITVHQRVSSGNLNSILPIPYVSNVSTVMGTFYSNNHQTMTNSSVSRIQQVIFPFRAIFTLSNNESVEILFNEKGSYDIYIESE